MEHDIIVFFDQLTHAIEERRNTLLNVLKKIKSDKLIAASCPQKNIDINGNCLRFYDLGEIYDAVENCGKIDESKAYAENSYASGIGLKYAICNEPTHFSLKTCNIYGDASWVEQDNVCVVIQKSTEQHYTSVLKNNCNGVYDVIYEINEPGCYEIKVKVNGSNIKNSPFKCCVFEKHDLKFKAEDNTPEQKMIQKNQKTALLEKTDFHRSSKLYSNVGATARAWKVRVIAACPKIKVKFGYCCNSPILPDLSEEYFCKFDFSELRSIVVESPRRNLRYNRKQSTFQRSSLTFVVIEDVSENLIHVAEEESNTEKITSFKGDSQSLIPFISIKHFCQKSNCPRPSLVFI